MDATTGTANATAFAFTDTSHPDATSWAWDFGDGTTSTQQHPSHTYTAAGTYTVQLTATNAAGSDTRTRTGLIQVAPQFVTISKAFSFASGLDGWTSSGTNCTGQHSSTDGSPAGSLSTTVSGKNRNATCSWTSPLSAWTAWGVPAGATVQSVRLNSTKSRVATCSNCLTGEILDYRLLNSSGVLLATLWDGRSLPAATESWQSTGAQGDQSVGASWQPASSQMRLVMAANLRTGNPQSSTVTLRQDELILSITYVQ